MEIKYLKWMKMKTQQMKTSGIQQKQSLKEIYSRLERHPMNGLRMCL